MAFLDPEKIISELGVKPGMVAADFGSGSGFFSIELAKAVGEKGKVYALDVQKETLEAVRSRAKAEHISNIYTAWADLEAPQSSKLKDGIVDFVLMANVIFEVDKKEKFIGEAWRVLKFKGNLAVIDQESRFSKEEAEKMFLGNGFVLGKETLNTGDHHYGILFTKPKPTA